MAAYGTEGAVIAENGSFMICVCMYGREDIGHYLLRVPLNVEKLNKLFSARGIYSLISKKYVHT